MSRGIQFLLLLGLALVFYSLNRGFDISDEGFYAMLADPGQANAAGVVNYDLYFKLLYRGTGFTFSIIELRILRLVGYFVAAGFLVKFESSLTRRETSKLDSFGFYLISLLAGYAFLPPTLSYNSLTVLGTCAWLALLRWDMKLPSKVLALGFVLALLVYVKFPAAILLAVVTPFLVSGSKAHPRYFWLVLPVPFLLLELLFHQILGESVLDRLLISVPQSLGRQDYQLELVMKSPLVGVLWTGLAGLSGFALSYISPKKGLIFLLLIPLALLVWVTHITAEWSHVFLLISAAWAGYLIANSPKKGWAKRYVLVVLALPFILHLGSNVYWLRIGIHYWVFWAVAFRLLDWKWRGWELASAGMILVLVFEGLIRSPFQQPPLWKQSFEYQIPGNSQLYIDPELGEVLVRLQDRLSDAPEILTVFRNSGFAYLLDKTIPGQPMYWEESMVSDSVIQRQPGPILFLDTDGKYSGLLFRDFEKEQFGTYQSSPVELFWKK